MRRHLWLQTIGLLVLALGVFPFSSQATTKRTIEIPYVPLFRMEMQGFTNESGPFGSPLLVVHQGETHTLNILFTREYTNQTITIMVLSLENGSSYGMQDMSLPEGITYAFNPYSLKLSDNATHSANLTIVVSPTAHVENVTIGVSAQFYSTGSEGYSGVSTAGEGFTLEIAEGLPTIGGFDLRLLLIIVGVVVVVIALIGLAFVKSRRKNLSKTNQPPPPHPSTLVFLFLCFLFSHLSIDRTVVEREGTKWSLIFLIMTLLGSFLLSLLPIDARIEGGNPPQSIG